MRAKSAARRWLWTAALLHRDRLVRANVRQRVLAPARPLDVDAVDRCRQSEPERQRQLTLREVARSAPHRARQRRPAGLDRDTSADAVAIRQRPDGLDRQEVI